MKFIKPIDLEHQNHVIEKTNEYIDRACKIFQYRFNSIPVNFDLKGRIAGMYRVRGRHRLIRFNPYLFAKYFQDNLEVTVPHEVAHYVTDVLFGLQNIKPHGKEWKSVMKAFDADFRRTCNYDLQGIPTRLERRFPYECMCTTHSLSTRRHNRIHRGAGCYFCKQCGEKLRYKQNSKTI